LTGTRYLAVFRRGVEPAILGLQVRLIILTLPSDLYGCR